LQLWKSNRRITGSLLWGAATEQAARIQLIWHLRNRGITERFYRNNGLFTFKSAKPAVPRRENSRLAAWQEWPRWGQFYDGYLPFALPAYEPISVELAARA
jgi:hypothetical protein